MGFSDFPASMDLNATFRSSLQQAYVQSGDALVFVDPQGNMLPALAESWEPIDDTTWEFKLKTGIKFQNGEEVTAQDVKFTYDRVMAQPEKFTVATRIVTLESTEVIDDSTVRFHLNQSDPLWVGRTWPILIVPEGYATEVGDDVFAQNPIGTGPFQVVEFEPDIRMVLEAVEGSWRGAPAAQRIEMSLVPEPAARVSALRSGQLDIIRDPPLDLIAGLESDGFTIDAVPRWTVNLLEFGEQSIFDDNRVRLAFNYAVDKQLIVDRVYFGLAQPAPAQMAPAGVTGNNPAISAYPFDPDRAAQLLEDAGWILDAASGFRMKDGERLFVRAEYAAGDAFNLGESATTQAVAQMLKDVGVEVELAESERSDYLPRLIGPQERVELSHGGWNSVPIPDADFVYSNFSCVERPDRYHNCNPDNATFEDLYAEQKKELDPQKRQAIWVAISEFLFERPVGIILVQPFEIYVYGPDVTGSIQNHPARIELMDGVTTSNG